MNTNNDNAVSLLTVLCISCGAEKELLTLINEFNQQDYAINMRELIIIDDGPVSHHTALNSYLLSLSQDISVRYYHSPQLLLAEEKVHLGVKNAIGEYFHFMTSNTCYPADYFTRAVNSVQHAAEKMVGTIQETLWLSPLQRLCTRRTRLPQYSALNTLCCHRSVIERCHFLLAANGWEASFARAFSMLNGGEMPIVQCHDIEEIIQRGLLINTLAIDQSLPERLGSAVQLQTLPDWSFFDKIACINLHQQPERIQEFQARLALLQAPAQKIQPFFVHQTGSRAILRLTAQLDVLKTARDSQWENVLILENDIHFVKQSSLVEMVNHFLSLLRNQPWNVAVFSAQYHDIRSVENIKNVVMVQNATGIGAWAIHKNYFNALINFFEQMLHQLAAVATLEQSQTDSYWQQLMRNDGWLGIWPPLCFPSTPVGDIQNMSDDSVPLFFKPLLMIDHHARNLTEGALLKKVGCGAAMPSVWRALAELNRDLQRYELENYYKIKSLCLELRVKKNAKVSEELPQVKEDINWPLASIYIPAYNQVDYLKETLASVFLQSYPNLEIIVVDDGSSDGTQSYMEGITDTRLRYIRNPVNLGIAENITAVFKKHSQGKYILIVAHDDLIIDRHYLWDAVQVLENDKSLALVFSNYYQWYQAQYTLTTSVPGPKTDKIDGKEYFINYNRKLRHLHLAVVHNRQCAIQAQAVEYSKHAKVEDLHCNLRTLLCGNVAFIPIFSMVYRIHEESLTFNQSNRNDIRPDIAFMQDMEKTRTLALEKGIDEMMLRDWFSEISINHFAGWRLPIVLRQGNYSITLSILAWMNKYYPDIGRAVLASLLTRK